MTLDKAHELIEMHVQLGSGYNRNAVKMVLGEIMRDFGQAAVDELIRRYGLEQKWEIKPGTVFTSAFKQ
jgi:hypothetical protein